MTLLPAQSTSYCLQCDYPLGGLTTSRCPECGHPFDLTDRRTFNGVRPVSKVGRWLLRPDGILLQLLAWISPVVALWVAHMPGFDADGWALVDFIWVAYWASRKLRKTLRQVIIKRYDLNARDLLIRQTYANWAARALLAIIILAAVDVPFRVCFLVSMPALNRTVRELQATGVQTTLTHRWTGLFYWDEVEASNWGVQFKSGSSLLWYHPFHPPYGDAVRGKRSIRHDWVIWRVNGR